MSSKLRPLYDKLYIDVDVRLLALNAFFDARKRAKKIPANPNLDREYRKFVKPFWKKYGEHPSKAWYRILCDRSEHVDPRYIPDSIWFSRVIPHFNRLLFAQALQDKCLHNLMVPELRRPDTVVKRVSGRFCFDDLEPMAEPDAVRACRAAGRFVIKPSVGSGKGADVVFYDGSQMSDADVREMFAKFGNNFIAQKPVRQHPLLDSIYPGSLNTIRVITFFHDGDAEVLSCNLRMGAGGSEIDNVSAGGYACGVNPDGSLLKYAVNRRGEWVDRHPDGAVFADVTLPRFPEFLEKVRATARKTPHFNIIGWDLAMDPDCEPVFIEYNVIPGQNQKTFGPTFGDRTGAILDEVFRSKSRKK